MATPPCWCSTYSIGSCLTCRRAVCGDHSALTAKGRECADCIRKERERASAAAAARAADERAAQGAVEEKAAAAEAQAVEQHEHALARRRASRETAADVRLQLARVRRERLSWFWNSRNHGLVLLTVLAFFAGPPAALSYALVVSRSGRGELFAWGMFWLFLAISAAMMIALVWLVSSSLDERKRRKIEVLEAKLVCGDPSCRRCAPSHR